MSSNLSKEKKRRLTRYPDVPQARKAGTKSIRLPMLSIVKRPELDSASLQVWC